jgi:metal-responsive CopG/Arc/MetJ family transcriptional regulator
MVNKQINVCMPKEWLAQLDELAQSYSNRKIRSHSSFEFIREALRGKSRGVRPTVTPPKPQSTSTIN